MVSRQFEKAGIDVEFFLVDPDLENPERGCFDSHRLVASRAKLSNEKGVMIFEDDIVFDRNLSRCDFDNINWLLDNQKAWEIIYLGGLVGDLRPTSRLGVTRCSLMCAHAYVLSRSGIERILSHQYSGMPVDVLYALQFNALSIFPLAVSQVSVEVMKSDLAKFAKREGVVTDKVWRSNRRRQYFSMLKNIAKFEILQG